MSFFGGGGGKVKPQFTGIQAQTSSSALPIPICWGQNRLAPNVIWQGDFKAHKQKQGKGGGKSVTTYTYTASFQMGLCWGEVHGIVSVWKDQSKIAYTATGGSGSKSKKGGGGGGAGLPVAFSFFLGTTPQAPWGYLTTKHPTEALGYSGIAHVDVSNYDLGQSNALGQHSFEVQGLRWDTGLGGGASALDADPTLIVEDFLTDDSFGVGFDMSVITGLYSTPAATTTGDSTFQTYCRAMGFALSPCLTQQTPAGETIERWAMLCNTAIVWNGYSMKFHPYGPDTVTGNGVTYIPDFPVRYTLTDADFRYSGDDPIKMNRSDPADAFNSLSMIISNRANEYNELPVPWRDQGLVDQYGLRKDDNLEAKEITELSMAQTVVALIGQRRAYIRNTYEFTLPVKYCLLEPMDVLTIVDAQLGTFNVLIREISETEDDTLEIVAEEYPASISSPTANSGQTVTNTPKNTAVEPGPVNPPIIFEPPSSLTGGVAQIWAAVSGGDGTTNDPNWGGAIVWISTDDIHYVNIGEIDASSRMGKLSATLPTYGGTNPDTGNTLSINMAMSAGELDAEASATDAEAGQNLCYVDGELISFEIPTLSSTYAYNLTRLWRGMYGSTKSAHASGSNFAFLDDAIFKYTLPAQYVGKTLYLKFQSVNSFDIMSEDLSTVTAYSITPSGAGFGSGAGGVPGTPTGLSGSASGNINRLTWTANSPNDNVTGYKIYRASGTGAAFGTASLIATAPAAATSYDDSAIGPGAGYTYFIVATNALGDSSPSMGANVTAATSGTGQPFGFAFQKQNVTASKPIAYFDSPVSWTLPSGLSNSQGTIGDSDTSVATAPSAQTDFDIQSPPGTSIGTMRFAASSLTATFIMASPVSIPSGQPVTLVAPSSLNGLNGTVYGSLGGTR